MLGGLQRGRDRPEFSGRRLWMCRSRTESLRFLEGLRPACHPEVDRPTVEEPPASAQSSGTSSGYDDQGMEVRAVADRSRVLVIDDDDTVREVLRRYLVRDGHEVLEAADGSAGLELALLRNPDLLVLDLMLPGIDG